MLLIAKENGSASAGRHILHSLCPLWQPEGHPGFYDSGLSCLVRLEGFATRFPIELLFRLLGHLYHIDSTIVEALKYGGGVRRKRRLTRLIHKGKVLSMDNPGFLRFDERFHRDCHMAWKAYYCQHLMDDSTSKARDNNSGMYTEQQ